MGILVVAEHDGAELKEATLNAVTAAAEIGGDTDILIAGNDCGGVAEAAAVGQSQRRLQVHLCKAGLLGRGAAQRARGARAGCAKAKAQSAVESGATIWTAGIGTVSGAALTLTGSTAPLLDGSGLPVVAGYDEDLLRQIADVGRGAFHQIEGEESIRSLIADLRSVSGRTETIEEPTSDPIVWLIMIGLALLVLEALSDAGLTTRRAP